MSKSKLVTFRPPYTMQEWYGSADQSYIELGPESYESFSQGSQDLIISSGHPYRLLGEDPADIGGDFLVVKRDYAEKSIPPFVNRHVDSDLGNSWNLYSGIHAWSDKVGNADFPAPRIIPNSELDVIGASAINSTIPTNPINNLLVSLGELRSEGIPSVIGVNTWKDRTLRARTAGGEYLNYQFGWLPLVSDIRSFANTVINSDEIRRQYEADSGHPINRTLRFPVQLDITSDGPDTSGNSRYPVPPRKTGYWEETGGLTTISTSKSEMWFEAVYTYYLPPQGTTARDLAIANKLWGTRLTPETVWNLTPWSWAIDWFSNAGDVISNIGAFQADGLVMSRAYLMCQQTDIVERRHEGAVTKRHQLPCNVWQRFTTTVKQRHAASPYGFGLALDALTDRQWSILIALGLSRGNKGMKYA